jgi:sterol desaturase/sphingolipid hydroxylase (fatty acid hydroxylase superfamily)
MFELLGPLFSGSFLTILRLSLWLTALVAIFVPLERLCAVHPQKVLRKAIGTDLCYYFVSGLAPSVLLGVPAALLAWTVHRVIPLSLLETTGSWPLWARLAAGLVAGEVGYYWGHRLSHEIPLLWRFHSIHHSAEDVDFLVNSRAHPVDLVFGRFCGLVPMYVFGLAGPNSAAGSQVPFLVLLIGTIWGFFIHANLRWRFGPLEWLVSTPAFHHWHHTRTGAINHNYASTLPFLDRIFGTHHLPRDAWPESYGIKAKIPDSLGDQLLYPFAPPAPDHVAPAPAMATSSGTSQRAEVAP